MPRSAPNRVADGELDRRDDGLAGLDLGQIEQIVDQLGQVLGRLADEPDLLLLLRRQLAVACAPAAAATAPGSNSAACGTRGSCSTGSAISARRRAADGRRARRARRRARRRRDWCPAAPGSARCELLLARRSARRAEAASPGSAGGSPRSDRPVRRAASAPPIAAGAGGDQRRARAAGSCPSRPSCPRPARSRSSNASIRRRAPIRPMPMPVADVGTRRGWPADRRCPARCRARRSRSVCAALRRQPEFDAAAAGIFERVARDLRDRGGDARLILRVEAEQLRDLPRPLAGQRRCRSRARSRRQQAHVHAPTCSTAASRPPRHRRARAGNRGTARRRSALGCCAARPG